MFCVLIRCFHALELIGSRLECVELLVSLKAHAQEWPLVRSFSPSVPKIQTVSMPRKPCSVRSSSSLVVKNHCQQEVGFKKYSRADYLKWKSENRVVSDGVNAKLLGCHGPLAQHQPGRAFLDAVA